LAPHPRPLSPIRKINRYHLMDNHLIFLMGRREQSFVAMSFPPPKAVVVLVNGCHPRTPLKGWAYARTATKCRPVSE
ncbi:MAG: hypothetical protein ACKOU6_06185, partial [Planctomycetota bacterium]